MKSCPLPLGKGRHLTSIRSLGPANRHSRTLIAGGKGLNLPDQRLGCRALFGTGASLAEGLMVRGVA